MKILLIQTSFIGDIILLSAAVENLQKYLKPTSIDILINQHSVSLYRGHPIVRKVLSWDKKKNKYPNLIRLIRQIRKEEYDAVINFHRYFSTGLMTAASGADLKAGYTDNPFSFTFRKKVPFSFDKGLHEVDRNHSLLQEAFPVLSSKNLIRRPVLHPLSEDMSKIETYQRGEYLCMCPSSVWFTKQFPTERWVELINQLRFEGNIYLLGAPSDHILCEHIRGRTGAYVTNLAGKLSLLQSAALMQKAVLNYVNDSAPLHLASATNAPVCAFFCSTVTDFGFYPLSDFSRVIEVDRKLYCRPCGKHGHQACPEKHFRCAFDIEMSQAVAAYQDALTYRKTKKGL